MSMVNAYVLICCDLAASEKVVEELEKNGKIGNELRASLARQAFALTAQYDSDIRDYVAGFAR